MIFVESKIPAIADLRVHPMPASGRVLKAAKTVRVGRALVVVDDKGTVYSSEVLQGMSFSSPMVCRRHGSTLSACVRLGLFTRKALDAHRQQVKEAEKAHARRYAAELLKKACKDLGVPMSITQKRAASAAIAAAGDD